MYFNEQLQIFPNLKAHDISRLIYIATYCDYKDNMLRTGRKLIDNVRLRQLLSLNNPQYYEWHSKMIEYEFLEKVGSGYQLNQNYFNKGSMIYYNGVARVFSSTVRNVYRKLIPADHYKLGYILKLISFVNPHNNALVENPLESNRSLLKSLTLAHFADSLGFNKGSARRITTNLLSMIHGKNKEPLIRLLPLNPLNTRELFIVINPQLFFGGSYLEYKEITKLFEASI